MAQSDTKFVGPVPDVYDAFMVPLLFQPYAEDMAARVAALRPSAVLETAAGSGAVTRVLAPLLAPDARYVVTDLNGPMLDKARARQAEDARLDWQVADALSLGFAEGSFDVVLCQFGAMFFPDRRQGYAEALRVLRPGGAFVFNVWDRLEENEMPTVMVEAVTAHFPDNPPLFFRRVPHGYFDQAVIRADLAAAGFGKVLIETVTKQSRARAARDVAVAMCQGSPMRAEIVARNPDGLEAATDAVEAALVRRFGSGAVSGKIQALVVTATA